MTEIQQVNILLKLFFILSSEARKCCIVSEGEKEALCIAVKYQKECSTIEDKQCDGLFSSAVQEGTGKLPPPPGEWKLRPSLLTRDRQDERETEQQLEQQEPWERERREEK